LLAQALKVNATDLLPDAELQAVGQSPPAASMVVFPDGRALVSVNQVFPLETALAIMKLIGTP
jgi:hypothetical protein